MFSGYILSTSCKMIWAASTMAISLYGIYINRCNDNDFLFILVSIVKWRSSTYMRLTKIYMLFMMSLFTDYDVIYICRLWRYYYDVNSDVIIFRFWEGTQTNSLQCTLYWVLSNDNILLCRMLQYSTGGVSSFIGASLSEPHTSVTALRKCVCIRACLLAAIYRKF